MQLPVDPIFIEAHPKNFNPNVRHTSEIKYIVIHYTSNTNDTARNNALYFRDTVTQSSAHFFVSTNSIYQTVQLNHAAYAVGLGSMKNPYFKWPSMWKKITNSNSVSIELCGSKTGPEANDETKKLGAILCSELLKQLSLTPSCVYRHYDVTGKPCPKWAVDDQLKWLEFMLMVNKHFYGEEDDDMKDTPENYNLFKEWMKRYNEELAAIPATWSAKEMAKCKAAGFMDGTRPKASVTREELATVVNRLMPSE